MKDDYNYATLSYADKDVIVTVNYIDEGGKIKSYNVSAKKGWNYLIQSYDETKKLIIIVRP